MTMYSCRIRYDHDRLSQKRIKKGYLTDGAKSYMPIDFLPPPSPPPGCCTGMVRARCQRYEIPIVQRDLVISAKVKKNQIHDFVDHVYGRDPSYFDPAKMLTWKGHAHLANSLSDLRAFIAQQLSSRFWYELEADEW